MQRHILTLGTVESKSTGPAGVFGWLRLLVMYARDSEAMVVMGIFVFEGTKTRRSYWRLHHRRDAGGSLGLADGLGQLLVLLDAGVDSVLLGARVDSVLLGARVDSVLLGAAFHPFYLF